MNQHLQVPADSAPPIMIAYALGSAIFWSTAYVLIIRRGFKDRSYGIPFTVLAINVAWEFLFSFVFQVPKLTQAGNVLWFIFDCLIAYTLLRYGAENMSNPMARRWYRPAFVFAVLLAGIVQWGTIKAFNDGFGKTTGSANAVINAVGMLALLIHRGSVRGQSFYIATCMFLGNFFAYFLTLRPYPAGTPPPPPDTPALFLHVIFAATLTLNLVYIGLVVRQCRLDGIPVLKRL